ncbi:response regulator transcription factor [Burkholderia cenocepacia]|uniref:response regulator transcription factor n=1 Tax=Burkholderia cenocepacia TaxID=95486 RepID=UPI001CF2BC62|nr:response regulator transcription factor [Burkholderia cenocepacia]MCA8237904.1 response regulator transcription factor [Burkholderia cenocepacia]
MLPIVERLRRIIHSRLDARYGPIVPANIEGVRNMNVLYLEDDPAYVELIASILEMAGYRVQAVSNGNQAIRHLESSVVDLLILDWQVPGMSGFEVLQWTRERIGGRLPILFLTNRMREDEIFSAMNAGADDYMVKPINRFELLARSNALLRRAYQSSNSRHNVLNLGSYAIDTTTRTALLNGVPVKLTPREFDLAVLLFRNPGRIMPRDALIRSLWGRDMAGVSRSLDTHIYRLRMKLVLQPSNGVRLSAVYTLGYRLEAI